MTDSRTLRFMTPRNLLLLAFSFGLYTGIVLRNPQLLFVGIVAGLVLGRSVWQAATLLRSVRVTRRHTPRAFEGQFVPVELDVESGGTVPQSLVLVEDHFTPGAARVPHLIERPLVGDFRVTIHYWGECVHHRDLYVVGPVRLIAWDDLGLFRRTVTLEEFTELLVYPTAVDLRMTEVLGEGTLRHVGVETMPRAGQSEEFIGLREYRIGDSPSAIHWRSTARTGNLMVKEFQEERSTQVTFFLDLGRMGLTGLGDQTSVEYGIKATASLAKRAIEKTHAVQVFAIGEKTEHIPPGSGTRHLIVVLDRLAFLRSSGEADFAGSVRRYLPFVAPGGTAVLVLGATTIDPNAVAPLIAAMRQRKILPLIVLIDDRAFVKIYQEQETRHLEAMSMEETVEFLTLLGARVHVVTKARTLEQALVQGLDRSYFGNDAELVGF